MRLEGGKQRDEGRKTEIRIRSREERKKGKKAERRK